MILNLINKEKSDISYEIIHFPDGEIHIKLGEFSRKDSVTVVCRITNAEDLFILQQVGDILNRHGVYWILKITYLMSMRMDRVISFNESFSLQVVANTIKALNPKRIYVYHAHSERTYELLEAFDDGNSFLELWGHMKDLGVQFCYPDAGAKNRYNNTTIHNPLCAKKVRNIDTGKIESIVIENPEDYTNAQEIVVLDDLCDAGGTFLGIAEALKKLNPDVKLKVYVYHMVNRKGIENLSKVYDEVIFTNSYKDWDNLPNNCTMIDIMNYVVLEN